MWLFEIKCIECACIKHVKDIDKRDEEKVDQGGVKDMTKFINLITEITKHKNSFKTIN